MKTFKGMNGTEIQYSPEDILEMKTVLVTNKNSGMELSVEDLFEFIMEECVDILMVGLLEGKLNKLKKRMGKKGEIDK